MSASRIVMSVMLMVFVSGCAGARSRQDLARLQSQVSLLDERVSQLERTGSSGSSSTTTEASMTSEGGAGEGVTVEKAVSTSKKAGSKSSSKPHTREIQQALKNAGFYQGSVDGKMGPATREAVQEFQRVNGLKDDGVVGKQTWAKLRAYTDLSSKNGEANAAAALK